MTKPSPSPQQRTLLSFFQKKPKPNATTSESAVATASQTRDESAAQVSPVVVSKHAEMPPPCLPSTLKPTPVKPTNPSQESPSSGTPVVPVKRRVRVIESSDDENDDDGDGLRVAAVDRKESVAKPSPNPLARLSKLARTSATETTVPQTPNVQSRSGGSSALTKTPASGTPSASPMGDTPRLTIGEDRKKARNEKFSAKNESKYAFLKDIRDAEGRPVGHPEYDPRTLYIPKSFWKEATPFEKQFWQIKSERFDTVVFFKKGKFYELFERDADIGSREFDLKLTDRAHMRMVGVPEASFEFWAAKFVAKGYKVAKVDQLETQLGKEMREKGGAKGKEDNIIRRELTAVLTAGTLVDGTMISNDMSTYCLAIKEAADHAFGVAFVDTATAEFSFCDLPDDKDGCLLETLIMQIKPREIVYEKGELSQKTMRMLKNALSSSTNVLWNGLLPVKEFWDADTTVYELQQSEYFADRTWPSALEAIREKPLALSAAGALFSYLRSLKLDTSLVSMKNFHIYDPVQQVGSLILDGQTLVNLEVFQNSVDGGDRGTLHALLNRCVTPYGKRLFKKWICHPLRSVASIEQRLDAVDDLNKVAGILDEVSSALARLPDLERLTSRIHAGSCKLKDFLVVLDGFQLLSDIMRKWEPFLGDFQSRRLSHLCSADGFPFVDMEKHLSYLLSTFHVDKARNQNEFLIHQGVEQDFDDIVAKVKKLEAEFNSYLTEQKKALGCSALKYRDLGKEIYQIEVPANMANRVPRDWMKRSGTKAVNRYHSPFLVTLVRQYQEALETRTMILDSLYARTLVKFDNHYATCWRRAVECVAEVDCLMSLARVSGVGGVLGMNRCRPTFVETSEDGMLDVRELRHPCVMSNASGGTDFIPNDIVLGGEQPSMVLLTGPNMGGKSTLLRQACVAIIMAQLGCYLPARSCTMTIFDRIFTRIGANDNIMAGQSTFMVELSETSKILHQATTKSMVILDELGRGTATFDGYAIAYSVLHHLAQRVQCCGLFSTHYGLLTSEFSAPLCPTPSVRLMHMACHVDANQRDVTFLYKLVDGVSPQSFGMNVASMAGVPVDIVDRAEEKAKEMQVEKGWIGCVGRRRLEGEEAKEGVPQGSSVERMGRSLLVQTDYETLQRVASNMDDNFKEKQQREIVAIWKAARARYGNKKVAVQA